MEHRGFDKGSAWIERMLKSFFIFFLACCYAMQPTTPVFRQPTHIFDLINFNLPYDELVRMINRFEPGTQRALLLKATQALDEDRVLIVSRLLMETTIMGPSRSMFVPAFMLEEILSNAEYSFWCPDKIYVNLLDPQIFNRVVLPVMDSRSGPENNLGVGQRQFKSFFTVALLVKHVIPDWLGLVKMTPEEVQRIRVVASAMVPALMGHFKVLVWAVSLLKSEPSNTRINLDKVLDQYLVRLNLSSVLIFDIGRTKPNLDHILQVASFWGLRSISEERAQLNCTNLFSTLEFLPEVEDNDGLQSLNPDNFDTTFAIEKKYIFEDNSRKRDLNEAALPEDDRPAKKSRRVGLGNADELIIRIPRKILFEALGQPEPLNPPQNDREEILQQQSDGPIPIITADYEPLPQLFSDILGPYGDDDLDYFMMHRTLP